MKDFLQQNSKAIAGALAALVVIVLKPFCPQVLDPAFQPALEIVVSFILVGAAVWIAPANKSKDDTNV